MQRLALVGFPDGLARQDIAPTLTFLDAQSNYALGIRFEKLARSLSASP